MDKMRWYGLLATIALGFLAWDNWQVRHELEQLQTTKLQQTPVVMSTATAVPNICPVAPKCPDEKLAIHAAPAAKGTAQAPDQSASTVQIPPGTDLLEAIKTIQREQAKTQPGSAAVNPFGTSK